MEKKSTKDPVTGKGAIFFAVMILRVKIGSLVCSGNAVSHTVAHSIFPHSASLNAVQQSLIETY